MRKRIALLLVVVLSLCLVACTTNEVRIEESDSAVESVVSTETVEVKEENFSTETVASEATTALNPEFKAAMDSYESFFDEYVAFMKKYSESNDTIAMLGEYTEYLSKYTETMQKMSELAGSTLSVEEALYYAQVNARISEKLMSVAQ